LPRTWKWPGRQIPENVARPQKTSLTFTIEKGFSKREEISCPT
jgi:hypothetical protein